MATWQDIIKQIETEAYSSGGKSSTYDSELARANSALAERSAAGLDTSSQNDYINKLKTGYNTGTVKGQAYSAGANNIDTNYVNALSSGNTGNYIKDVISKNSVNTSGGSTTYTPIDNTKTINKGYDTALQSTIDAIRAAVQQSKNKQTQVISQAEENYPRLKTLAYNQSLAGLPGMNENTANLGASSTGGYSRTETAKANTELQNRMNDLELQKQDVINQANFAIADLEAQGKFDEANATKETALAKLQAIVSESSRLDQLNQQNYQFSQNYALQESGLTGVYKGQQTQAAKQQELDNLYRSQVFNYQTSRDAVADTQWQQTMNLNLQQQSFVEAQQKIETALAQKRISQEDASQALQWAKYNAEMDENSLDNQIKKAQLEGVGLSNTQTGLENANLSSGLTASGGTPSGGTTATEQKYAEEVKLAAVLDSKPTVEEKVAWIQANKANIIATFGKSYYDNLLANPY